MTEHNCLQSIARHVMSLHQNLATSETTAVGEIDIDKMKRFISYCKRFALANHVWAKTDWRAQTAVALLVYPPKLPKS